MRVSRCTKVKSTTEVWPDSGSRHIVMREEREREREREGERETKGVGKKYIKVLRLPGLLRRVFSWQNKTVPGIF